MNSRRLFSWISSACLAWTAMNCPATEPAFTVKVDVVHQELNPGFCWFHPRVAAIPGQGKNGQPAVMMTIQKHLVVDDYYSGLWTMRTDDLGATWTGPTEIPELAWSQSSDGETLSIADVTPGWHEPTKKLIAIGIRLRYSKEGRQLLDKPRSHHAAYAIFDPKTNRWTTWKSLETPHTDGRFHLVAPGCVQWVVKPDGSILLPMYFKGASGEDYSATVLHCGFDGETLTYRGHGDELAIAGGRGFAEPSLAAYDDKYWLTLRNDARGYVAVSKDGLTYGPLQPWQFDDGSDLGSYNTQAHWLTHSDGLYLAYTRRGANNDHIARNRAPLFLARVDTTKQQVIRATEQILIPERGVMLGNFGAAPITSGESWVTDAEFINDGKQHLRGANGSTFAARVLWKSPNKLVPTK